MGTLNDFVKKHLYSGIKRQRDSLNVTVLLHDSSFLILTIEIKLNSKMRDDEVSRDWNIIIPKICDFFVKIFVHLGKGNYLHLEKMSDRLTGLSATSLCVICESYNFKRRHIRVKIIMWNLNYLILKQFSHGFSVAVKS